MIPYGEILHAQPSRGWVFGLGHLPLFAATAGVGVGLHVVAYYVEGTGQLSEGQAMLAAAIPVAVFLLLFFGLVHRLLRRRDRFHLVLIAGMLALLAAAVLMGYSRLPSVCRWWCSR